MKVRWSVLGTTSARTRGMVLIGRGTDPECQPLSLSQDQGPEGAGEVHFGTRHQCDRRCGQLQLRGEEPSYLCNPVNKNGSGVVDASLHYCCYKIKCTPNKIPTDFDVTDQFGPLRLESGKASFLCNPCTATGVP